MSEFLNTREDRTNFHRGLLTTASVVALLGFSYGTGEASDDSSRPTVWIELGGQLSRLDNGQEPFTSPIMVADRPSIFSPSQDFEKQPPSSFDATGKLSFEPNGSDWVFSASVRFGRSSNNKDTRQKTNPKPAVKYLTSAGGQSNRYAWYPIASRFSDTTVRNNEQHFIVDFQVGKDVGFGIFGKGSSSVLNLGVRFAQFGTQSNIALKSDPDWKFHYKYTAGFKITQQAFHTNRADLSAERSFHGVGPSLSWNGSAPFLGNTQDGELLFDGGLNAAILFGRQRAKVHHQTSGQYRPPVSHSNPGPRYVTYQPPPVDHARARTVAIPNVGGFAGLTYQLENFKASAGYRADFFFGAMDGGVDARKSENVGFYGPFATVSIGLGG